jgi:integrase
MSRIYKRGKTWYADFEYKGKRYRKSLGTASKQVAQLALKDMDVKIARERFDLGPTTKLRFDEFGQKFLEWYQVQNSAKSYRDYISLFSSTIIPYFAAIQLTDISIEMVEKYKIERSKSVSPSTVNKELIAIKHVLNKAILWGYLTNNPAKDVGKLRVKEKKFRFLSLEEIELVLNASPDYARIILLTAIHTGMRRSELFRLEWEDVDFERGYIVVTNKHDAHTKNYQIREIPMTAALENELKRLQAATMTQSGNVFIKSNGEAHGGELRKTIARILKEAGIKPFTLHDLRHTFASHLVMEGVDLPTVQKLMGHSDIKTTMIYAHLAPDHLRSSMARLDRRLGYS